MANQDDFELFLNGVESWNDGMQSRFEGLDSRQKWGFLSDLSDTDIGFILTTRALKDGGITSLIKSLHYPGVDFTACDLRRANFRTTFGYPFDFREANFEMADLRETDLTGADLTGAVFGSADLRGAVFHGATLDDARIENANLADAELTGARPWRAQLFSDIPPTIDLAEPTITLVQCVKDLIDVCSNMMESCGSSNTVRFYYRGQDKRWKLRPSVMRHGSYRGEEGRMLLEMMTRRPEDFANAKSALSQWVLAQHHGLKTRLLDVTKNPLVALFYACESDYAEEDGYLHILAVPTTMVKPYDSDAVSIVANFAKLSRSEQNLLLGKRRGVEWRRDGYADVLIKLYHLIGQEKPHFQRRIDPRDFYRVFVVEPQQSFERLRAQSGAFLVSAFHERFESDQIRRWNSSIPTYRHYTLTIPHDCKGRILEQLKLLNITHETLFPGLASAAEAITGEYSSATSTPGSARYSSVNRTWRKEHSYVDYDRLELSSTHANTVDGREDGTKLSDSGSNESEREIGRSFVDYGPSDDR